MLNDDFKENIAGLSIISFFFGSFALLIIFMFAGVINPALAAIVGIVWLAHSASCFLAIIPLSRFWLPEWAQSIMLRFVNFGVLFYNSIAQRAAGKEISIWVWLIFNFPEYLARFVRYIIIFPLYTVAKHFVGDKIVGVVKQNTIYYAGAPEWYIETLIEKSPNDMSDDELYDLSYLNTELGSVI